MNIFKQFIKSLYSPKTMASFRFQGIGKTILFVFFLVLLTSIPKFVNIGTDVTNFYNNAQEIFESDVPDFYIEENQFHADVQEPYVMEESGMTIIFDPENELSLSELKGYQEVLAFQKDEALLVYQGTVEYIPFSDFQGAYIGKEDVVSFLDSMEGTLPVWITVIIIASYVFFSATKFIQVTILGLVGLILKNALQRSNLNFRHTWIMSAYAVTIPSVFFAIMEALSIPVPGAVWLNFAIAVFVLFLIIKEVKVKKIQE
ncbi:DUF1189 domain-containing protein [Bacillus tianshenii]|uniref:DUF1189 domain-containing protein n=1 Tax=Sutcliffiella tianshenii TaxID=1463404 RepID=UPI001CD73BDE|nr:DUF1189 domain-containing protein [Bacillus tianshenii]MCA1318930.1 DUF1189 domain-containing protein [Bacillus tianshenii]